MTTDELITLLRSATEDDVTKALDNAHIETPLTEPADLLEFYNRVVDVLLEAGDVKNAADRLRIPPGFGSTE
jgi:hypothetical protein